MKITKQQLQMIVRESLDAPGLAPGSGSEGAYQDAVSVAKEAYHVLEEIMEDWENTPEMNSYPGKGTPEEFKQRVYAVMDNILNKEQQF